MLANVPALSRNPGSSQSSPITVDTKSIYKSGQERQKSSAYSPILQRSSSVDDATRILYQSSPTENTSRQEAIDMNVPNRRASVMRSSSAASISRTNSPLNPSSSRHYYRSTPSLSAPMPPPLSSSSNGETRKRSREDSSPQDYKDGSSPVERPAIRVKTEDNHIADSIIASSPLPLDVTGASDSNVVVVKEEPGQEPESEVLNDATRNDPRANKVPENQISEDHATREADLRRLRQEEEETRIVATRKANLQSLRQEHEEMRILEEQKRLRQVAEEQAMIIEKEAAARSAASRSASTITAPPAQLTPRVDYSRPIPPPYRDSQENASLEDQKRKQQQQHPPHPRQQQQQQQQQQQVTEAQAKAQAESEAAKVAAARAGANPPETQRSPYYRPQLYASGSTSSLPPPSQFSPQSNTQHPPRRPTFSSATSLPVFAAAPPSEPTPPAPPKLGLAHFDLLYKQESSGYVCKMCM